MSEDSKRETESDGGLARTPSLFDITMIGLSAMIGAGIFVLIGDAAGEAGPAFLLNGLIAFTVGAAYAELGSAMPTAGGSYEWVRSGVGPRLGFASGWISWFGHAVACSLYALGFGSFTAELLAQTVGLEALPLGRGLLEPLGATLSSPSSSWSTCAALARRDGTRTW